MILFLIPPDAVFLVNGEKHRQVIDKYSCDEIRQWMDVFKNASGKEYQVQLKYEYSGMATIHISFLSLFCSLSPCKFFRKDIKGKMSVVTMPGCVQTTHQSKGPGLPSQTQIPLST